MTLGDDKAALRVRMRALRKTATISIADAGDRLTDCFCAHVQIAKNSLIAGYVAQGSELDPSVLLKTLFHDGHRLCLPVTNEILRPLLFYPYQPGAPLHKSVINSSLEPFVAGPAVEPDILLVPLLAFDDKRRRLGQGGGAYDCTIADLKQRKPLLVIGLAFSAQEVAAVPVEPWDVALDKIVTEKQSL